MAENDFLPFAAASGANVLDQADYAAASATATGFVSGVASSAAVNKTLRQSSIMAAVIAKFIVNEVNANVIDDGTLDTIINNFILAIRAANPSAGGTVTGVSGTAPITSSGGTTPAIGISAATETAAGSMSAADKTKLDSLSPDAAVVHIAGAETITGNKTFSGNAPIASGSLAGWQFNDRTQSNFWIWFSSGGAASLYSSTANSTACSVNPSTLAWSFPASITATTANFTSSDRRLKRNIRKIAPRPLHRSVRFVGYTLKESGWYGLGSIAQNAKRYAPEHVGTFDKDGKTYYSLNYAGMAYEQAMWAGQEVDRLTKRIAKLERALDRAKIEPRKRGLVRRLLEKIW
jgi:hypothetical protein